jgi:DNA-binding transcriptional MerR regulator
VTPPGTGGAPGAGHTPPVGSDDATDALPAHVPDKLFFRIGEIAELVGVEPHVLRYWESEFRIRPQRSSSGQRMYRRKDLAKFLRIKKLLHEEGYTIAGARKSLADPGVDEARAAVDDTRVREAIERIAQTRERIRAARERFARPLSDR